MRVLDLFSGIGGFSLGLERAGMRTVAFCEIDPYCQRVLAKHWPDIPCYGDIRTLTAARLAADGLIKIVADAASTNAGSHTGQPESQKPANRQPKRVLSDAGSDGGKHYAGNYNGIDAICGGFPCQDISVAGKGAGIGGERSGLWSEYRRLVGELRPRYVVVENVAALLNRGIDVVLGDLAALGYDAEWHCIPASAVGAPHRRDRVWIIAYPSIGRDGCDGIRPTRRRQSFDTGADMADTQESPERAGLCESKPRDDRRRRHTSDGGRAKVMANAGCEPRQVSTPRRLATIEIPQRNTWWRIEPNVGRVAHGVPNRVHRLRALGNAVVPQIPELIGRAILNAEQTHQNTIDQ